MGKITVEFKFSPDDMVATPMSDGAKNGLITHCTYDSLGDSIYCVRTTERDVYWNEKDLVKANGE